MGRGAALLQESHWFDGTLSQIRQTPMQITASARAKRSSVITVIVVGHS